MKKLILGVAMFATGFIGFALMVAATLACNYTLNGSNNYADTWRLFGITPFAIGFFVVGLIGMVIAIWGIFSKQ